LGGNVTVGDSPTWTALRVAWRIASASSPSTGAAVAASAARSASGAGSEEAG
jgi:hypothetical protein